MIDWKERQGENRNSIRHSAGGGALLGGSRAGFAPIPAAPPTAPSGTADVGRNERAGRSKRETTLGFCRAIDGRQPGNFRQAFSHLALINTAHNLASGAGRYINPRHESPKGRKTLPMRRGRPTPVDRKDGWQRPLVVGDLRRQGFENIGRRGRDSNPQPPVLERGARRFQLCPPVCST